MAVDTPVAGEFMTPTDAWIWYLEGDPRMRWTISAVMLLDRPPDFGELRDRFERATRLDPRFRQKVVEPPLRLAPPRWTPDRWFDLDYHLRRQVAPAPGTLAEVLRQAEHSAMSGLDRARPLWQATLIEGLEGRRAALVVKMHHALTDGVGGLQLALHLVDAEPGVAPPLPEAAEASSVMPPSLWREIASYHLRRNRRLGADAVRLWGRALGQAVTDPLALARQTSALTSSVARAVRPISDTKSPVMTGRSLSWRYEALDVPFDDLKRAARKAGGTVNDAFIAGITGGLRRYHERHGAPCRELRVSMPISLREEHHGEGGNHVTIMRFTVPVDVAEPSERMAKVHEAARSAREEPAVPHMDAIASALSPVTPVAVAPMAVHMDFTASNVPGYRFPVYLCGAEVERVYPFGPTGGASANVTMITYRDTCCVGVNSDPAAVPDAEAFHHCLAEGFDEVLAIASADHPPSVVAGGPAGAPEGRPA